MAEGNRFAQPWTIFSHAKYNLQGEAWGEGGKKPTLKVVMHNNNPRFRVYMNNGDKNSGAIPFSLDPIILQELFQVIRHVVADKQPSRFSFELKSSYDHRGNKTDKPGPVAKIFVGRDSDGVIYLAVQAKGEALAKFPFLDSFFAELRDATGEKVSKDFASEVRALAWVNAIDGLVGAYSVVHGKEPDEKPGSGGGNRNKSGGWGGKPQASSQSADWGADVDY